MTQSVKDGTLKSGRPNRFTCLESSRKGGMALLSQGLQMNLDICILIMRKLNLCLQMEEGDDKKAQIVS